ncbi:hypothetical protein [Paenisporosarcina indica]|nr:hypothetical protein [Paenisporosarcina indica]
MKKGHCQSQDQRTHKTFMAMILVVILFVAYIPFLSTYLPSLLE